MFFGKIMKYKQFGVLRKLFHSRIYAHFLGNVRACWNTTNNLDKCPYPRLYTIQQKTTKLSEYNICKTIAVLISRVYSKENIKGQSSLTMLCEHVWLCMNLQYTHISHAVHTITRKTSN